MGDFKEIKYQPKIERMHLSGRNLELVNEFLQLGITKRKNFVDICQRCNSYFRDWQMGQTLVFFWLGNSYKQETIIEVEKALKAYKKQLQEEAAVQNLAQDGKY